MKILKMMKIITQIIASFKQRFHKVKVIDKSFTDKISLNLMEEKKKSLMKKFYHKIEGQSEQFHKFKMNLMRKKILKMISIP